MNTILRTVVWCLILFFAVERVIQAQAPVARGTKVYPKSESVEIRIDKQVIGTASDILLPPSVRFTEGDWLWIWIDKKHTEGWIYRGDVFTADEAIENFPSRIADAPNDPYNYYWRAAAYLELGNLTQAMNDHMQRIRISPSANSYTGRGMVWTAKKEFDIAILDHTDAIRLDPFNTFVSSNREIVSGVWGREFSNPSTDVMAAEQFDPSNAIPFYNRGIAWTGKGKFDTAIRDYTRAIQRDPLFAIAYDARGFAKAQQKDFEQAILDYNRAIRIDPHLARAYNNRGRAMVMKEQYVRAQEDFLEAIRLNPKYAPMGFNYLAYIFQLRATTQETLREDIMKHFNEEQPYSELP